MSRASFQPHQGRTFRIVPLAKPLDQYVTHTVQLDGQQAYNALGKPVVGSAESLRREYVRMGATEVTTLTSETRNEVTA